jgi:hypothetical protein
VSEGHGLPKRWLEYLRMPAWCVCISMQSSEAKVPYPRWTLTQEI